MRQQMPPQEGEPNGCHMDPELWAQKHFGRTGVDTQLIVQAGF